jgi:hypothetical protein
MKIPSLISMLFLGSCTFFSSNRTANIKLDPKNNGWYFIKLIIDTTLKDTGTINIEFDDTTRFAAIKINNIDKTIVNPFDYNGNSLSRRLQYFGVKATGDTQAFLKFYNPTDEELMTIEKWNPTDKRAWGIWRAQEKVFNKYYKDTIPK